MTRNFTNITTIIAIIVSTSFMISSTHKTADYSSGASEAGCNCHGSNMDAGGSFSLTGIPDFYTPNQTYAAQVCLTDPSKSAGGFSVSQSDFAFFRFTTSDANAQSLAAGAYMSHTSPQNFGGGAACWDFNWVAPPAGSGFKTVNAFGNAVNLSGDTSGDNGGYTASKVTQESVMPVSLISFSVENQNNKNILLNWETGEELNNDYFEIERSLDNREFDSIGKITGSGTSMEVQRYTFMDETIFQNQQVYYRLKQVDFDGSFEYSIIQSILVENKTISIQNIYPNPVVKGGDLTIAYIVQEGMEDIEIGIFDIRGYHQSSTKMNAIEGLNQYKLNLNDLAAGQYFVRLTTAQEEVMSQMFVVQE